MSNFSVPLKTPSPDINRFIDAMLGKKVPKKAPMCEYLIDDALMKPILVDMLGRKWIDKAEKEEYMGGQMDFSKDNLDVINGWLDNQIAFWYHMGYDYVRVEVSLPLPAVSLVTNDTAVGNEKHVRAWQGMGDGPITDWESFEKYPWPKATDENFYIHEYICQHLPEGLGFVTCHAGGVYEHVSRLMGYTGMCMNLFDNPELVAAVANKLGEIIWDYNTKLLQFPNISAIFQGEDFGYNTQTLISPNDIRKYFLPWHKKFATQCHGNNRPYFIHSCGMIDEIMEELINDVKIDGKHSFQDNIHTMAESKKLWGDKIALLGGADVHKLSVFTPDEVRAYIRKMIEDCSSGGRFAVGAGNSVTSYIPMANYLAMVESALE